MRRIGHYLQLLWRRWTGRSAAAEPRAGAPMPREGVRDTEEQPCAPSRGPERITREPAVEPEEVPAERARESGEALDEPQIGPEGLTREPRAEPDGVSAEPIREAEEKRREPTAEPEEISVGAVRVTAGTPREPEPERWRRLHVGLDFGTCWSKLVLRDYGTPEDRAIVVVPGAGDGGSGDFRIPSLVAISDGTIHFGFEAARLAEEPAARVLHSLKMRAAKLQSFEGDQEPLPEGLSAGDLSTLVILYLIQLADRAAQTYAQRFHSKQRLSVTAGAPMESLADEPMRDAFIGMVRAAHCAYRSSAPSLACGISLGDARALLEAAGRDLQARGPAQSPRDWLRSEAEAALLWAFRSPAVGGGLYASVDVGAGSTDATFFRITEAHEDGTWRKAGMAFFGAVARPPGMDAIGDVIRRQSGAPLHAIRGREESFVERLPPAGAQDLRAAQEQIFSVYAGAFRKGYPLDKRASSWSDYGLFLIGGGSKFGPLRQQARQRSVWEGQLPPGRPMDPGRPHDLRGPGGGAFEGDPTFLLVAYGLSHFAAEVPMVGNPDEIPPLVLRRPKRMIDQDEWHPR